MRLQARQFAVWCSDLRQPFVLRIEFGQHHDEHFHLADGAVFDSGRDDDTFTRV